MPQLAGFVAVSYHVTVLSSCCTASLESFRPVDAAPGSIPIDVSV